MRSSECGVFNHEIHQIHEQQRCPAGSCSVLQARHRSVVNGARPMIGNRSDEPYLKRKERRGPACRTTTKAIVPRAGPFIHVAHLPPLLAGTRRARSDAPHRRVFREGAENDARGGRAPDTTNSICQRTGGDHRPQPDDIITKSRKTFLCGRGKIRGGDKKSFSLHKVHR
jgi:hypothetical protein